MSDVTPEELAAIRERAERATPGPWIEGMSAKGLAYVTTDPDDDPVEDLYVVRDLYEWDAEFIAHAREDVPRLLDALQAAEADRDAFARKIAAVHDIAYRSHPYTAQECAQVVDDLMKVLADTGDAAHQGHK